jgi:signal transduction histidine kinase
VQQAAIGSLAALLVPLDGGQLIAEAVTDPALVGTTIDLESSVAGQAIVSRAPIVVDTAVEPLQLLKNSPDLAASVGRCVVASLGRAKDDRELGVLLVGYPADHRDVAADVEYLAAFASQAGVALQLAQAQKDRERLVVLEDRDRIARDLHDLVIQRLFATGMSIQSAAPLIDNVTARERMATVVDDLDATIRDLRQAIYQLQVPADALDLRAQIQAIVDQSVEGTTARVRLHLDGPVASSVSEAIQPHFLAALRESLSNAVRHAHAAAINISVTVDDALTLEVTDDGLGIDPAASRRSGLANLAARAAELGGQCESGAGEDGRGTTLTWQVPLDVPA